MKSSKVKKNKIFISIASYRDPQLIPTIEDCINNASDPQNLIFGILRQYNKKDSFDDLSKYKSHKNFRIKEMLSHKSKGVCHSRHQIQKLYEGEEFYLQLDSHHRFVKGWDTKLKSTLQSLKNKKVPKPILTAYLPSFDPDVKGEARLNDVWRQYIDRFQPEGPIFIFPETIPNWKRKRPEKARFTSGHFIFSYGNFVTEVPYDPKLYFHGEESSLAVRAFTHGFDLFHLHRPWIWHHYGRDKYARHWDDETNVWGELNKQSFARYKSLLGMDGVRRRHIPKYGLGKIRTLEEYEHYAGIRFKDRKIHQAAYDRTPPPVRLKKSESLEDKFIAKFKYCIDLHKPQFPENDYDVWAIAFKDKNGNEMIRLDADSEEIKNLQNENKSDDFIRLWREFETSELPHSWLIWPHSKSKDWKDIVEGYIPVE